MSHSNTAKLHQVLEMCHDAMLQSVDDSEAWYRPVLESNLKGLREIIFQDSILGFQMLVERIQETNIAIPAEAYRLLEEVRVSIQNNEYAISLEINAQTLISLKNRIAKQ